MEWNNIVNIHEVDFEDWQLGDHYSGKTAELSRVIGTQHLGFHLEKLAPGKFSCPYHFHHSEEEFFLVFSGKAMLRQNNEYRELKTGDLVFFKTGEEGAHSFYNHTNEDFVFLALSNRDKKDICEYPDSQKVLIRKNRMVFHFKDAVPYITGEEEPRKFWDEQYLKKD